MDGARNKLGSASHFTGYTMCLWALYLISAHCFDHHNLPIQLSQYLNSLSSKWTNQSPGCLPGKTVYNQTYKDNIFFSFIKHENLFGHKELSLADSVPLQNVATYIEVFEFCLIAIQLLQFMGEICRDNNFKNLQYFTLLCVFIVNSKKTQPTEIAKNIDTSFIFSMTNSPVSLNPQKYQANITGQYALGRGLD